METIELNFGVHIDHYIAVNFSMLGKLINSIGGLTLTVKTILYAPHQRRHRAGQPGAGH